MSNNQYVQRVGKQDTISLLKEQNFSKNGYMYMPLTPHKHTQSLEVSVVNELND